MKRIIATVAVALAASSALAQEDWKITMVVDNQFDAYYGTNTATNGLIGSGTWPTTYTFNVGGRLPTDYLYVATASDWDVAQGFLGDFENLTTEKTTSTGDTVWKVFPVGAYLQDIDASWPSSWPKNVMPTQSEVDQALVYGAANPSVWVTPAEFQDWDNRVIGNITTWGYRTGIDPAAEWIWNNTGSGNPFSPGANHDEFLIFRVPGAVPTPGPLALLGLGGLVAARRRRT